MATGTIEVKRPHERQREFIGSAAKRKVIRAGRRGGKTVGVSRLAIDYFLEGFRVLYATPTQEQIMTFWNEIVAAFAEPINNKHMYKNESMHIIDDGLGRIRAKTAWNADTLRGDFADLLILDEFQLMEETAWTEVGVPMLLDNNGDAVFIYTPPSRLSRSVSKARDPMYAGKLFKQAQADTTGRWEAFHFTSHDNPHISHDALEDITQDMSNLAYRQEILAEDVEEIPGALWKRQTIDDTRLDPLQPNPTDSDAQNPFLRIVVAIDPAATSGPHADETGIIVAGLDRQGQVHILEDATATSATPEVWANVALNVYDKWQANLILGETNQGGEMIEHTLRTYNPGVPFKKVHAKRGKALRAEPVSVVYEQGKVHHRGVFPDLEEQMCTWVPGFTAESPDRLDALVYAVTELKVTGATIQRKQMAGF